MELPSPDLQALFSPESFSVSKGQNLVVVRHGFHHGHIGDHWSRGVDEVRLGGLVQGLGGRGVGDNWGWGDVGLDHWHDWGWRDVFDDRGVNDWGRSMNDWGRGVVLNDSGGVGGNYRGGVLDDGHDRGGHNYGSVGGGGDGGQAEGEDLVKQKGEERNNQ